MGRLIDSLGARSGVVCAVGAGGKKTTLYHLAATHPGRVGLTCTVPNTAYPSTLPAHVVVAPAADIVPEVIDAAKEHRVVAFALPPEKKNRYAGIPLEFLEQIRRDDVFDVLLVKADGARMRWIKAPGEDEPSLPANADSVIPIASARALGEPLDERVAHRPQRVAAVTGMRLGDPIEPADLARLLASEEGALKGIGGASVYPVINMVDDPERARRARETAEIALQLTDRFESVALTSTSRPGRLVEVVYR